MNTAINDFVVRSTAFAWIALATCLLLRVPLLAMRFTAVVNWGIVDFVVKGALLFGTGSIFVMVVRKVHHRCWLAVGVAFAVGFLCGWQLSIAVREPAESREYVNGAGLDYPWTTVTHHWSRAHQAPSNARVGCTGTTYRLVRRGLRQSRASQRTRAGTSRLSCHRGRSASNSHLTGGNPHATVVGVATVATLPYKQICPDECAKAARRSTPASGAHVTSSQVG